MTYNVTYYSYKELFAAAKENKAGAVEALAEWFEQYGDRYWNGEYFECDDGYRLFPVYDFEGDEPSIKGYELR